MKKDINSKEENLLPDYVYPSKAVSSWLLKGNKWVVFIENGPHLTWTFLASFNKEKDAVYYMKSFNKDTLDPDFELLKLIKITD